MIMSNIWILAEAGDNAADQGVVGMVEDTAAQTENAITTENGSQAPAADETGKPQPQGFGMQQIIFMVLIFGVMYLFLFRGPKKKQQEHQKMVASLAKNDRVRTIGGIFATVLDVRDDEIVLKIDESTNTKMRVSPGAIATVLKDKDKAEA